MWLLCVFGGVLVLCGVLWGVSIMREWGKDKANPQEKSNKKLTRELEKPILALRGSEKFL